MKVNCAFMTDKAKERLRIIKKNYRQFENPDMSYRDYRNSLLAELSKIPQVRKQLVWMIGDIQMRRATNFYNQRRID